MNTDGKIRKLVKENNKQKRWFPVLPNSSLYLVAQELDLSDL